MKAVTLGDPREAAWAARRRGKDAATNDDDDKHDNGCPDDIERSTTNGVWDSLRAFSSTSSPTSTPAATPAPASAAELAAWRAERNAQNLGLGLSGGGGGDGRDLHSSTSQLNLSRSWAEAVSSAHFSALPETFFVYGSYHHIQQKVLTSSRKLD
jgi:hypothetical protein